MKSRALIGLLYFLFSIRGWAQELPSSVEQQLENATDAAPAEDDDYLLQLERFRKHRLDLNTAGEAELRELLMLNELQVQQFISYRNLFGKLISLNELQAVPGWDISLIRRLLPFVALSSPVAVMDDLIDRFKKGEHSILLRVGQDWEQTDEKSPAPYKGSPQKIFFRYRYVHKNLLQFGMVGDKDAGEQFFKGAQKMGFDFYSWHLFIRKLGAFESLAVGDFTVNMGQGLIMWQSLAFGKNSDVLAIKRQSPVIRPYNSAGEYNFQRGLACTVRKGPVLFTLFVSTRKLNANIVNDTLKGTRYFSSFLTSGYNRSASEIADRGVLGQFVLGAAAGWQKKKWRMGLNMVGYRFSLPLQKSDEPYNLFSIRGQKWLNASVDYSYTTRNLHFFGETAIDACSDLATVNGLLLSADRRVDLGFLVRIIGRAYQAVAANAFTENTTPNNENGIYTGICIRPGDSWRIDLFGDIFRFPWLRYRADAPGFGSEFLAQVTYLPAKAIELSLRFRAKTETGNEENDNPVANGLASEFARNGRLNLDAQLSRAVRFRTRVEMVARRSRAGMTSRGFGCYYDLQFKPANKSWSIAGRFQYFETDDYESRIYAFENDVLYSNSIPAFSGKGTHYYILYQRRLVQRITLWLRWTHTISAVSSDGSAPGQAKPTKQQELKIQLRWVL